MRLQVSLLGKFRVSYEDPQAAARFDSQKVQELFSYLLLHLNHPVSRETLAGTLWGDHSTAQSKKYLRQALWHLRAALDAGGQALSDQLLYLETDSISLNLSAPLWVDIAAFEQAYDLGRETAAEALDRQQLQALDGAVRLYQGDLLEGWYQDWCLYERERLQNIYLMMLEKLAAYCESHGKYQEGTTYAASILRYDPAHELTHAQLMRMYYLAGDRTSALRQYRRCIEALDRELSVGPSDQTMALYEQIRDELALDPAQRHNRSEEPARRRTSSLSEILDRLRELEAAIQGVHRSFQRDLRDIEQILNDRD